MKREAWTMKRFLSLTLALLMVFSMMPQITIGAKAASAPTTLYLKPNTNWKKDNARFAAYFFGNGEKWVSMTKVIGETDLYEVAVPAGYPSVIFCRMKPSATANNWDNRWNQTGNLTVPTDGKNCYTVKDGTWDKGGGTWSTCDTCYKVAGTLNGSNWAILDDMTNTGNGVWTYTYKNIDAGTYEFKITRNGAWWPNDNVIVTVDKPGSTVTITFNASTKAVNATVVAPIVKHTVTFNNDGATTTQPVEDGKTASEPTAPTKTGYTFTGWYNGDTEYEFNTPVTAPITLTAQWEINKYTVTFNSDSGSAVDAQTIEYNKTASEPTAPTKTGYTFAGWYNGDTEYTFNTPVTAPITLTAKWTVNTYTVTFNVDGEETTKTVNHGETVQALDPAPTKEGYNFAGWFLDGATDAYNFSSAVTDNITLTAKWTQKATYTVTFDSNGGTVVTAQTVEEGKTATAPETAKTGYTFVGWYKDGAAYDFNTLVTAPITLTAQWTANGYKVVFDANEGTGEMYDMSMTYDADAVELTANVFTKEGHTFNGWNTQADGEGTSYADGASVKNLTAQANGTVTLYAQWKANTYTVTFDSNGGSEVEAQTVEYGKSAAVPTEPTFDGHVFAGWFLADAEDAYDFKTPVTGDITLNAKWTSAPAVDYYLIGNINGADYGCEGDSANMGEYKFVDGKLTVTFTADSYVFIKTTNSADWYMTNGWLGTEATSATLYNTKDSDKFTSGTNKLFVPKNVEIAFTLVVNEDDTLTLSYEKSEVAPPVEATYIVAGTAGLCGAEWDPANTANKMTLGKDGLYSITYENVAAGTHSFKVTDGSWNNSWGGSGKDGNYEITLNAISNVTITFNAATDAITVKTEATGEETVTTTYTAIFHFANTIGWNPVNLYVWNDGGATTGNWPGSTMTKQDDNGYQTMTVSWDAASNTGLNYIFNSGDKQTVDLKLDASAFDEETNIAEIWVELNSTAGAEGKYTTKQVATAPFDNVLLAVSPRISGDSVTFEYVNGNATSVEVRGTIPGATWDSGIAMTKNAKGIWTVTVEDLAPAIYKYKFVVNGKDWYGDPANGKTDPDGNSVFTITDPNAKDTNTVNVHVFYDRADGTYEQENAEGNDAGIWNAHVWGNGFKNGRYDYAPDANDVDGDGNTTEMVTTIEVVGRETQGLSLKNRMSTETKEWLREEGQVDVLLDNIVSGTVFVYVKSAGTGGNAGNMSYSVVYSTNIVTNNKITDVSYNYDKGTVIVTMQEVLDDPAKLGIINTSDTGIEISSVKVSNKTYTLTLNKTLDLVNLYQYKITFGGYEYDIAIDAVYASDKFAEEFTYDGVLGATYASDATTFKVWAPTAEIVSVNLYTSGTAGTENLIKAVEMTRGEKGVWTATVSGDLNGTYYTYAVKVEGETIEAVDPYARTTGVNGNRGMVIDLDSTDPTGWATDKNPNPISSYTDAVIYELHVRDFSNHASSGMTNKGKYLAFTEEGTKTSGGVSTGIDYLDDLGITHLHLLPVYDYGSVDESKLNKAQFNWGYDPVNYNVPEGSYSTNPYDGATRVSEFKQMVKSLHDHDISVVMDVVYNHVYNADKFCFNNIVPGYFSRVDSNTSGCGNDTASEREMVRKYIVESVLYWHQEYHIDGFRFDLVGLLDTETINQIVEEVHACCPDVIFYGEGWDMDGTNKEPGTEMAKQGNASKTPGFAYFSDNIRNLLGGDNGKSTGFASGAVGKEGDLVSNFMANPGWTTNPEQVIQYASCHDNYTLVDKLIISTKAKGLTSDIIKMNNLAAAVYMTAQGVPFIHAGEEMLREKLEEDGGRSENSYNASDNVNNIDWSNLSDEAYKANVEYYKGLIAFRQAHPALRMADADTVKSAIQCATPDSNVIAFLIDGSYTDDDDIFVIFNANTYPVAVTLPQGVWNVCIDGENAGTKTLNQVEVAVMVDGISAMVLTRKDEGKNSGDVNQADASKYQVGTYTMSPDASADTVTVYFSNNKKWNTVIIHYWGGGQSTEWPGVAMTYKETNGYGEDIYSATVPAGTTGIIFNDGSSEQTVDITDIVDGQGYYCTNKGGNSSFKNDGKYSISGEYYLHGYINGMDYACEDFAAAMGNYKFVDDKLTVNFETDSYVGVKTVSDGSLVWYMTDGWLGNVSSATLYNSDNLGSNADKLMIPGGMEVTLSLTKNNDNTVTLSYTADYNAFEDNSGIQNGVTLHCWNWSFEEIEKNMATIAAQGYTAIQTSPVQAMKEETVGKSVGSHWWVYYQPVDFKITTAEGNALGTKAELESMVATAHKYGIKVIVDVVANHLGNKTGNDLADAIPEYLRKDAYWHDILININADAGDWNNRHNMTQYCLTGLPDLNTANKEIQGYVLDFLKECVDIGVDGFRFDMAKSIETPYDHAAFASDFWPTVVGGIQEYAGNDLYIYGEVLDNPAIAVSAYTEYMSVTDNSWGNDLRGKVSSGTAALSAGYHKAADASNLVIWAESHDTYATDDKAQSSAGISEANINKTWALVAARADAMGLYLARPESLKQELGVAASTGWDNPEVEAVNEFHNAFVGQSETLGNSGNISYVVRGTTGIVLVNTKGAAADVNIAVTMADGKYADHITGNVFTVENGKISGKIGDTGIAVVSQNPYMELNTSNMTLENSLAMNFWVYPSDLREDVSYTAELTRSYADGSTDVDTVAMSDWTKVDANDDDVVDYYQIPYTGLAAKEMNDEIVIQIKDAGGTVVGEFTDSIRDYAEFMIKTYADNEDYAEFVTSMVDMLNYGAAAQKEFGYDKANLANAGIEAYQHLATKGTPKLEDSWAGNGIGYGSNLELKENIILHIWFKNAGVESAKITYKDHYGDEQNIVLNKSDFQVRMAGISSVAIDTLVVADGAQEITCTFYSQADAKGERIGEVTESVESYLKYMLEKDTNSNDLYVAIAKFIDSSYKSFH